MNVCICVCKGVCILCVCVRVLWWDESVFECLTLRCSGAHGPAGGGVRRAALEGGEAAGERRLQLRGEEDSQLCDDASCDELVRSHIERRVPHLDACGKHQSQAMEHPENISISIHNTKTLILNIPRYGQIQTIDVR